MLIEIIAVGSKQKIKTYYQVEVTYKDLDKDKVGAKKLMSFSYPEVFNTLSKAEKGENYEVTLKKEGEYWNWVDVSLSTGEPAVKNSDETETPTRVVQGKDYETREERAQKQIYIIRQSCLSNAVSYLTATGTAFDQHAIFSVAADMEQWVLRKDPMKELINMPDDVIE